MTNEELQRRVATSPALTRLQNKLTQEFTEQVGPGFQFDPITIIMIVSIIVQVIIHCRQTSGDDEIKQRMYALNNQPPRKLMRLRRRLNNLWREQCGKTGEDFDRDNPVVRTVYTLSDTIDDATVTALMELASAQQ